MVKSNIRKLFFLVVFSFPSIFRVPNGAIMFLSTFFNFVFLLLLFDLLDYFFSFKPTCYLANHFILQETNIVS